MAGPGPIAETLLELAGALEPVSTVYDHEPEKIDRLPAISLEYLAANQRDHQTGPATEVEWAWALRIYVSLTSRRGSDFRRAEHEIRDLSAALQKLLRDNPTLGDTCYQPRLADPLAPIDRNLEEKWAVKEIVFFARTEEH